MDEKFRSEDQLHARHLKALYLLKRCEIALFIWRTLPAADRHQLHAQVEAFLASEQFDEPLYGRGEHADPV